jgi:hypothetical protein
MITQETIKSRIKIDDNGCWIWQLKPTTYGYGQIREPQARKMVKAHRASYQAFVGEIPAGLTLDHLCRVRLCVNPAHLEPVTNKENLLRGENSVGIKHRQTHCIYGHPLSGDNLYMTKRGNRMCKTCSVQRTRDSRAKAKI